MAEVAKEGWGGRLSFIFAAESSDLSAGLLSYKLTKSYPKPVGNFPCFGKILNLDTFADSYFYLFEVIISYLYHLNESSISLITPSRGFKY